MKHYTNISREELNQLYHEVGLTQEEIAQRLGCSRPTISRLMADYEIATFARNDYYQIDRSNKPIAPPTLRHVKEVVPKELLDEWTPDLAYAVGLITSDGNLPPNSNKIHFVSTDEELIDLFCGCLQLASTITPHCYLARSGKSGLCQSSQCKPQYVVEFADWRFRAFLESVGLKPNKSKTLGRLAIPDNVFFDFLRGEWDGDGSWYTIETRPHYLRCEVASASPVFLHWLHETIERTTGLAGRISGIRLFYAGAAAVALGHRLYYALDLPCLSRKYAKWRQCVAK